MQDDQAETEKFDSWLRDAARSYNAPPVPDVDGMWASIEQQHFAVTAQATPRANWYANSWIRVAAALVLGVGLGRATLSSPVTPLTRVEQTASAAPSLSQADALPALNAPEANKYLGETVALLASLQSERHSDRNDKQLVSDAADLLNTTRFLLDAPTTTDPKVRGLLEDLELVLAQVVQLPKSRSASDVELIHQAMEQRDVMPRLRTAVANNYSAE
ncbi:MAG: hypothetical protein M3Y64_11730 [Gemmatimonadota bacterium]|nr:hypothetical protein [Gemmatimonadota bacterium]